MRNALLLVLAVLLLLPGCDVSTPAQATPALTASTTDSTPPAPTIRRCGFHIDATPSVNEPARNAALKRIAETLPALIDDAQCTSISVAVFTNGGWFTPIAHFPLSPERHAPCAATAATPAHRVLEPFEGFRTSVKQQCHEQLQREKKEAYEARKPVIAEVTTALSNIATVRAPCTDLFTHVALVNHVRGEHDRDWLLSDSAQSCDDDLTSPVSDLTFIIVPSNGEPREVAARGMTNADGLTKRFPGSTYILPAELSADGWWKGRAR